MSAILNHHVTTAEDRKPATPLDSQLHQTDQDVTDAVANQEQPDVVSIALARDSFRAPAGVMAAAALTGNPDIHLLGWDTGTQDATPDATQDADVASIRDLSENAVDLTVFFEPDGARHVDAVASALGDMLRERGWRDPAQIEAATELVRRAGRNVLRYLDQYVESIAQADLGHADKRAMLEGAVARLTVRISTEGAADRCTCLSSVTRAVRSESTDRIHQPSWTPNGAPVARVRFGAAGGVGAARIGQQVEYRAVG